MTTNIYPKNRKIPLIIGSLVGLGIVSLMSYIYLNARNVDSFTSCTLKKWSSTKSVNGKTVCRYFYKTIEENSPKYSTAYKTYEDNNLIFQYPSNWQVLKDDSVKAPGSIYTLFIASERQLGVLKSNGLPNKFSSSIIINIYPASKEPAACQSCRVERAIELSSTKLDQKVWQIFSKYKREPASYESIEMQLSSVDIKQGTENFKSTVKLPNGNFLELTQNVHAFFGSDQNDPKNLRLLYEVDDFLNSSSYLASLSILGSLQVK